MPDRDLSDIRLVGTLGFVVGALLMVLTILAVFLLLIAGATTATGLKLHGLLSIMLALIMALALTGCGGAMRTVRTGNRADLENLRLVWTALVLVMVISIPAGFWLVQPLADLAVLMLLSLIAVRGAVIRITSR